MTSRLLALSGLLAWIAGCTNPDDLEGPRPDLGDFRLGHNVVVAPKLVQGPASRKASPEEWIAAVTEAIDERFRRYEGERLYHLGISVDGYVLALPGVPVIAAPKSILILQVTVWDDARARKLNDKPKRFTVVETLSGDTVVGSGLTLTREEQMRNLSRNAAKQIETWLLEQKREKGWFESGAASAEPDKASVPASVPRARVPEQAAATNAPTAAAPAPRSATAQAAAPAADLRQDDGPPEIVPLAEEQE